ncbi:MAG: hypothetical protein SGBAC_002686 [Bacillariaceae sp.]
MAILISKYRNRRDTTTTTIGDSSRHGQEAASEAPFRTYFLGDSTKEEIEARKEYLGRNLKTHKVVEMMSIRDSKNANKDNNKGEEDQETPASSTDISKTHKGDLILSRPLPQKKESSDLHIDDDDDRPMCAICVTLYEHGDAICWSNNHKCHHCFHKDCIQEWLLQNEDCPCCRLRYLESQNINDNTKGKQQNGHGTMEDNNNADASHGRRNLRLTAEDEETFQRMVASLRSYFHSLEQSRFEVTTESIPNSGRDDHHDHHHDGNTMDTSGWTEVTDQDNEDQHPPQQPTNKNGEQVCGCVDIELGIWSEQSSSDDASEEYSDAHLEEQTQHC